MLDKTFLSMYFPYGYIPGKATEPPEEKILCFVVGFIPTIGWVATHTDPKNNTTSVGRDGLGRITQVTYQDLSTKSFVYDCCSLGSVTDSNGTITFAYDTLKRLSSVTDIYGKVVSFGYDKNSNLTTLTYPDGKIVNYDYDDANRLTKVTDWLSNVVGYNYDLAGGLIKTNYPDGSTINYQFDNGGRLTGITDFKLNGSLNAFYKYTLDQLGNRTGISSSQPLNIKPTPLDTSYGHDTDNRLLTAGSISFGYDNNGNLITKTLGSNVTNYSWDFNDMLTQVTKDGNTYIYRYDALGNRVAKVVNSVETRYVGGLAETDASGNIAAYYVYGFGLISKITPSNESYFYHFDGIGSTIAITDVSGNVVNKYAYDEHGKVLNQEEAISNPFKYVGRFGVMDEGNGLLYMRARYYDPEVGRFISKDPIGFAGGLNLYAYAKNNPVNLADPWGLDPGDRFRTRDDAALDAIAFIILRSFREDTEYGGYIYMNKDGSFSYTVPVPGTRSRLDVKKFKCVPAGSVKAAVYHTHPGRGYAVNQFSPDDRLLAISDTIDVYLGTISGHFAVYNRWKGDIVIRE